VRTRRKHGLRPPSTSRTRTRPRSRRSELGAISMVITTPTCLRDMTTAAGSGDYTVNVCNKARGDLTIPVAGTALFKSTDKLATIVAAMMTQGMAVYIRLSFSHQSRRCSARDKYF
jgi:hypothetical protein